jgi:hypothetical protein
VLRGFERWERRNGITLHLQVVVAACRNWFPGSRMDETGVQSFLRLESSRFLDWCPAACAQQGCCHALVQTAVANMALSSHHVNALQPAAQGGLLLHASSPLRWSSAAAHTHDAIHRRSVSLSEARRRDLESG